ncbi:putative ankyrin repeat-containing domain-containing protein [Helianthus annuus]|nr:putative ankyrin repeat-containing domain-containing protein [Helianthus annuus]
MFFQQIQLLMRKVEIHRNQKQKAMRLLESKQKNVFSAKSNANDKGGNPAESEAIGKVETGIKTKDSHPITIVDTETETRDKNVFSAITTANDKGGNQAESEAKGKEATQIETKDQADLKIQGENFETKIQSLFEDAIRNRKWGRVVNELLLDEGARKAPINSVGNTVLHIAVGLRYDFIIKRVLRSIKDNLTDIKNFEGSTLLHIAAIVGNTNAAQVLIKHDKRLLNTTDNNKKTPLDKAYENMHLDTIDYLLMEAAEDETKMKKPAGDVEGKGTAKEIGVKLLVNAISAKHYGE